MCLLQQLKCLRRYQGKLLPQFASLAKPPVVPHFLYTGQPSIQRRRAVISGSLSLRHRSGERTPYTRCGTLPSPLTVSPVLCQLPTPVKRLPVVRGNPLWSGYLPAFFLRSTNSNSYNDGSPPFAMTGVSVAVMPSLKSLNCRGGNRRMKY